MSKNVKMKFISSREQNQRHHSAHVGTEQVRSPLTGQEGNEYALAIDRLVRQSKRYQQTIGPARMPVNDRTNKRVLPVYNRIMHIAGGDSDSHII